LRSVDGYRRDLIARFDRFEVRHGSRTTAQEDLA